METEEAVSVYVPDLPEPDRTKDEELPAGTRFRFVKPHYSPDGVFTKVVDPGAGVPEDSPNVLTAGFEIFHMWPGQPVLRG